MTDIKTAEERARLFEWALDRVTNEATIEAMIRKATFHEKAQRLSDAVEDLLTEHAAEARREALQEASKLAIDHAFTHLSTRHLGPEINSLDIAKAIEQLGDSHE